MNFYTGLLHDSIFFGLHWYGGKYKGLDFYIGIFWVRISVPRAAAQRKYGGKPE